MEKITINDLRDLVTESVKNILSELDWRTYLSAKNKASDLADNNKLDRFERKRRSNQAKAFSQASYDASNKQYGTDKIEKKKQDFEKENPGKDYEYTNGELKRLHNQADDTYNFMTNKQEYKNGKWQNKTNESVNEMAFQNNQGYSHFAVNKATNKIVNGWDYSDYDPSELRQFKNDYFNNDLIDNDLDPKQYKIVTGKYLLRQGIDPNNNNNWANS